MPARDGHTKYDIVLWKDDQYVGFMFDMTQDGFDQETSDVASEYAALSDPNAGNAAGVYGWRDQTTIPGVAMSDFRGGGGQRVLDSQNAAANAFFDSAFVDCRIEGEATIAPAMLFLPLADSNERDRVTEGIAYETASNYVTRIFMSCEDPSCVRFLEVGEFTALADRNSTDTGLSYTNAAPWLPEDVARVGSFRMVSAGDFLYNTATGEIMKVSGAPSLGSGVRTVPVTRSQTAVMGEYDSDGQPLPVTAAIEAGDIIRWFGLRTIAHDYASLATAGWDVSLTTTNTAPKAVTSMVTDSHHLFVSKSDTNIDGIIWQYDPRNFGSSDQYGYSGPGTMRVWANVANSAMTSIGGIRALCFAGGLLYFSTNTLAGFIADDATTNKRTAYQLSADAVVGAANTDRGGTLQPEVRTVGLVASDVWVYWVTTGGSRSRVYRLQAPSGFQLVANFPKGFTATCAEAAFGNVYIGGYYRTRNMKNGDVTMADYTYEGAVYILKESTLERLFTLKQTKRRKTYSNPPTNPVILDNRIKGITATSDQLIVTTPTQVYAFNVTTGGYWHMHDLPDSSKITARGPAGGGTIVTPDVSVNDPNEAPFSHASWVVGPPVPQGSRITIDRTSAVLTGIRESDYTQQGPVQIQTDQYGNTSKYTGKGGTRTSLLLTTGTNFSFARFQHNALSSVYKYAQGSMRFGRYANADELYNYYAAPSTIQGRAAELIVASYQYEARLAIEGVKRADGYWDAYIHVLRWAGDHWADWTQGDQVAQYGPFEPWLAWHTGDRGAHLYQYVTLPGYEFGLRVGPNTVDVYWILNSESWSAAEEGMAPMLGSFPVGAFRPRTDNTPVSRVDYSFGCQYPTYADANTACPGTGLFKAVVDRVSAAGWQEGSSTPYSFNVSDGVGAVASFDGALVVPILDYGTCVSLPGVQYRGNEPAFIETSDSYQNMATVTKMYRRLETSHSKFVVGEQRLLTELYMDGSPDPSLISASDATTQNVVNSGDYFTSWNININARKFHSRVYLVDNGYERQEQERLRLNVIAMRFLPASGPNRRTCIFDCTDTVECRDGTRWDMDAKTAIDFLREAKHQCYMLNVETTDDQFVAYVENYTIKSVKQDEDTLSDRLAIVQVTFRVIVE